MSGPGTATVKATDDKKTLLQVERERERDAHFSDRHKLTHKRPQKSNIVMKTIPPHHTGETKSQGAFHK